MSKSLKILEENRLALLKAEIGALLHNVGKLGKAFPLRFAEKDPEHEKYKDYKFQSIVGIVDRQKNSNSAKLEDVTTNFLNEETKNWLSTAAFDLPAPFDDRENYFLGDFIEFQAHRFYKVKEDGPKKISEHFPDGSLATELLEAAHDVASGGEKEIAAGKVSQERRPIYCSTVFGDEIPIPLDQLDTCREDYLVALKEYWKFLQNNPTDVTHLSQRRSDLLKGIKPLLIKMVADTQRPINDVTLWDISRSVAALHKALLSEALLNQKSPLENGKDQLKWHILNISFDGPAFWESSYKVADLLGRRQVVLTTLNQIKDLLEVKYPIGNEIYRDEYGSLFILADIPDLLKYPLEEESEETLFQMIYEEITKENVDRDGKPEGLYSDLEPAIEIFGPFKNKKIDITVALSNRSKPNRPVLRNFQQWWRDSNQRRDICSVCGVRPMGFGAPNEYYQKKAEHRNVCFVCLNRRDQRSQNWMENSLKRQTTIWIDEVADDNGYAALIVGRFNIKNWLSGENIAQLGIPASFARVQRVWRTVETFWNDINDSDPLNRRNDNAWIGKYLPSNFRLRIEPLETKTLIAELGAYHAYEAEFQNKRIGLVWHPDEHYFLSTDNLNYLGKIFNIQKTSDFGKILRNQRLILSETVQGETAYSQTAKSVSFRVKQAKLSHNPADLHKPYAPLTSTPEMFMTLLPAQNAITAVSSIKAKYLCEMGKVHNRLALTLGIVYFHRRVPLRAVLDSGRNILNLNAKTNSYFDYEFLDTTSRRFEVFYTELNQRYLPEKQHRPYPLLELDEITNIWNLLKGGLSKSQIRSINSLINFKRYSWQVQLPFEDSTFVKFVEEVFNNADWHNDRPKPEDLDILKNAAISGLLDDVLEIYFTIHKEKMRYTPSVNVEVPE